MIEPPKKKPFSATLGNPPFSKDGGNLYPKFFEKSLELSDSVGMIFPLKNDTKGHTTQKHMKLIQKYASHVSDDIRDQFPSVSVGRMSYVIASSNTENEVPEYADPLLSLEKFYPERKRVQSTGGFSTNHLSENHQGSVVTFVKAILDSGPELVKVDLDGPHGEKISTRKIDSNYLLLTNYAPSNGRLNTHVVKNDGKVSFGKLVFKFELDSLEEANKLAAHFNDDEIKGFIDRMLKTKETWVLTKTMMDMVPSYE